MTVAKKVGKDCSVKIGTYQVQGMGRWEMSGVTTDLLESTEFGDEWKQFMPGLKDGGEVSFDGLFCTGDTTGQDALIAANAADTSMTDIRLYVDSTSYWTPTTTNPASTIYITQWKVAADKSGLATASFTGKIAGKMYLA